MSDQTITLTKVYNPLDRSDQDIIQWQYQPGSTVADLLDNTGTIITKREGHQLVVSVNGQVIPADQYDQTHLVPGQCVTLVPVLTGGSTDSKNVLRTVGLVVLAVIATVVSVFVPALWPVTGFLWKMAFTSAIMTVGMAIYGAFAGGGSSQAPALNGYQGADQSNSYSWNPQTTQQQGIPIPWYYGTCKVSGNVIGVWRESIGSQQYLNALICVGDGVLSGITDIMLNDQPLANYTGIELHTRLGHLSQPVIPNFGDTVTEYAQGTKVNYGTPVSYTTIGADFDALEVEVGFPNGLYYYDDYGNLKPLAIKFSISIRKVGTTPWTVITQQPGTTKVSDGGYWSAGSWSPAYYDEYGNPGPSTWSEYANGGTNPNSYYDGQSYNGYATWRWIGEPIRVVDIMLDYVTAYAGQSGTIRYNYRANGLEQGQYEIQVSRLSTDYTDTRHGDEFYLMAVREVVLDDFTYPGTALIGLRALATDQLSGSFSFSCRTTGKMCRVHTGAAWTVTTTSNPAWVCFDILTQPVFDNSFNVLEYRAHNPDNLDLTRWIEWAQYCDDLVPDGSGGTEKRLTYNGGFDSSQSMWDAALSVARTGRATPYWRGTTVTVAIDKPSSPVALISVGNIGLDSFEETFLGMDDRAGSIEADFLNIEKSLDRDKFTVINPDAPPEWGSASLPMQGVIRPSEVWRHCRYHLATTQNLTRVVTVQMDTDSIAFTLGDIIQVQHDVPMWGEGGRVVSATTTTLVLDKQVTIAADKTYSIMLRLLDGTIVERTVVTAPGITDTITISTPFTTAPDPFDVYAFGEVESSIKPMRVVGIDSAGDLKRKITLTDYNETVYNADLLQPVLPTVNYSLLGLKPVTDMALSERLVKRLDGVIDDFIVVTFVPPANDVTWSKAQIWYTNNNVWQYVGESTTGAETLLPCQPLETYRVKIVSLNNMALPLPENMCPVQSISTLGKTAPPADVTWITAEQDRITWANVSDVDVSGYEIRIHSGKNFDWGTAQPINTSGLFVNSPVAMPVNLYGETTIMIKAVDTSGNYSKTAASTIIDLGSPVINNILNQYDQAALSWPGTITGGTISGHPVADSSTLVWSANDQTLMWSDDTTTPMWSNLFAPMTYEIAIQVTDVLPGSRLLLAYDYNGTSISAQYRIDGTLSMWSDNANLMWTYDEALMWTAGEWRSWPGSITAVTGDYVFRLSIDGGAIQGELLDFAITVDAPDITENLYGVAISSSGTRLAPVNSYRAIKGVNAQLISGGTARTIETLDKLSTGPMIGVYDSNHALVAGTIDATIIGY